MTREVARDGELVLREREDGSLELRANGVFVMDTVETSTEQALATRALTLHHRPAGVLIGGLGLGFTLASVLADTRVETVSVVEIEPALVTWLRTGVIPHGPALLADPRLHIEIGDIAEVLRTAPPSHYDLVLLDVDNGPGYLVHAANAGLYRAPALTETRRITRPGGIVAIWSAAEAPELATTLEEVFGRWRTDTVAYEVTLQGRPETYWLYLGYA